MGYVTTLVVVLILIMMAMLVWTHQREVNDDLCRQIEKVSNDLTRTHTLVESNRSGIASAALSLQTLKDHDHLFHARFQSISRVPKLVSMTTVSGQAFTFESATKETVHEIRHLATTSYGDSLVEITPSSLLIIQGVLRFQIEAHTTASLDSLRLEMGLYRASTAANDFVLSAELVIQDRVLATNGKELYHASLPLTQLEAPVMEPGLRLGVRCNSLGLDENITLHLLFPSNYEIHYD